MGMNSNQLITDIKSRLNSELGFDFSKQIGSVSSLDIILEEVIKHIQDFAVVKTRVNTSVSTVISGSFIPPATAVTGSGSGSGSQIDSPGIIE